MVLRFNKFPLFASTAIIGSLFFSPSTLIAQDGSVALDEITIIGTRTEVPVQDNPRSVSVVDQDQLKRQAPLSIGEALRDVPGVELVDAGVPGMKRLRIRGESSRRVTILVDGQEITDHSSYGTPILVNPAAVERIDVIRGPASVLWGAKAIGGVINIITKKGVPGKAAELELGGTYYSGTDGRQGWASLGGTIGNFDYRITGGIAEHDDQRTPKGEFTDTGRLATTAFENDDISAHIGLTFGANKNHYLAVKAEQYRLESETWSDDPLSLRFGVTNFLIDLPQRDRKKIGVYYDGTDLSDVVKKVHFDAYYQTIERLFENDVSVDTGVTPPSFAPISVDAASTSDDTLTNYGATFQADMELIPNHLTIFGVQYLADALETDKGSVADTNFVTPNFVPPFTPIAFTTTDINSSSTEARIDTFSIFAQDTWKLTNDLNLTAGIRYNRIEFDLERNINTQLPVVTPGSSTEDEISTSLGVTYTGFENVTLRALYSSGYISPTLLQLYGRNSAGGATVLGNPDLEIEHADNYEIGFRYNGGGLVIDATAYYTESEDYINFVACGTAAAPNCVSPVGRPFYQFANLDEAETYGAELLMQYTLPGTRLTPYMSGAYTRRKLQYDDFSTYDTNVPRLSGRFGLRYETDIAGIAAWADLYVRASTETKETEFSPTADAIITDEVDSWGTLNFAFGGTYGPDDKYRFAVEINNITDEEYRPLIDALPGVGRSIEVTAAVKF